MNNLSSQKSPTSQGPNPDEKENLDILTKESIKPIYSVYKVTNSVNGKIYIGRTKHSLIKRLNEHKRGCKTEKGCRLLFRAMRKHGVDNFSIELLETCLSFNEMKKREGELIKFHDSCNPLIGYNLRYSTEDGEEFISEELKKRMSSGHRNSISFSAEKPVGVWFYPSNGPTQWYSSVQYLGESFSKYFQSKEDAIEWYDKMSLYFQGPACPINNESKRQEYLQHDLDKMVQNLRDRRKARHEKFEGIILDRGHYRCQFLEKYYGSYKTEDEAVNVRDRIALYFNRIDKMAFPDKIEEYKKLEVETKEIIKFYSNFSRARKCNEFGLLNVEKHQRKDGFYYRYNCQFKGERIRNIGFKSKEFAGLARDIVAIEKMGYSEKTKLNFPISSIFLFESDISKCDIIENLKSLQHKELSVRN